MFLYFLLNVCASIRTSCSYTQKSVSCVSSITYRFLFSSELSPAQPSPALPGSSPPTPHSFLCKVSLCSAYLTLQMFWPKSGIPSLCFSWIFIFNLLSSFLVSFFLLSFFPFLFPLFFHQAKATLNIVRASGATCHTWPQTCGDTDAIYCWLSRLLLFRLTNQSDWFKSCVLMLFKTRQIISDL